MDAFYYCHKMKFNEIHKSFCSICSPAYAFLYTQFPNFVLFLLQFFTLFVVSFFAMVTEKEENNKQMENKLK